MLYDNIARDFLEGAFFGKVIDLLPILLIIPLERSLSIFPGSLNPGLLLGAVLVDSIVFSDLLIMGGRIELAEVSNSYWSAEQNHELKVDCTTLFSFLKLSSDELDVLAVVKPRLEDILPWIGRVVQSANPCTGLAHNLIIIM